MKNVSLLMRVLIAVCLVAALAAMGLWFYRQDKLVKMSERIDNASDPQQKITLIKEMLDSDPGLDKAVKKALYNLMAQTYSQMGQSDDMYGALMQSLALDPNDHNTLNNLAYEWAKAGRNLDSAIAFSQRSVALARDEFKNKPWDMDQKRWERVSNQTIGNYLDTYGWALYQKGSYSEALVNLKEAFLLASEPTIEYHLGMALAREGQQDSALTHLAAALAGQLEDPGQTRSDFESVYLDRYKNKKGLEEMLAQARTRAAVQQQKADSADAASVVGRPAPDFTLSALDGTIYKLSEQRGRVIVLDFWATWCQPCKMSLPLVDKANLSLTDRQVVFYAVNLEGDDKKEQVSYFWKQKGYSFTVLLGGMMGNGIDKVYQVTGIPTTYVIDKEGIIRFRHIGYRENLDQMLKDEVESLLR
jgi:thiol-disulfide isomerase/thioredoxin